MKEYESNKSANGTSDAYNKPGPSKKAPIKSKKEFASKETVSSSDSSDSSSSSSSSSDDEKKKKAKKSKSKKAKPSKVSDEERCVYDTVDMIFTRHSLPEVMPKRLAAAAIRRRID